MMNWQNNLQKVKRHFERDGYVVLPGFFSPQEVQELLGEVERYLAEVVPHLPAEEKFYEDKDRPETLKYAKNMSLHDAYFEKLYMSERFVRLAELLLDGPVVGQNLSLFNKPPRVGDATPPHQDGYYFMLDPSEALTMWLALDPVDEENGCVRYVTGSHLRGLRDHQRTSTLGFSQSLSDYGLADEENEVAVYAEPGDLLIHHCMTIHRADHNRSDRTRRALGAVYYSARARPDAQRSEAYQKALMKDLAEAGKI
jgi:phytanoyl-CoA hydroxylase